MSYIFLDESGDLGFNFKKKKTTKFFIVTLIFSENKETLERMVKKVFRSFKKSDLRNHSGTLHAYKETPKTRIKLLNLFNKNEALSIMVIYLDKTSIRTNSKDQKHIYYNYIANIILDRIFSKKLIPINNNIHLIASKRDTNKFLNLNFSNYIKKQTIDKHGIILSISIIHPSKEKALQVVDMISWAVFRKYEHLDESYYNLINKLIVEENPVF